MSQPLVYSADFGPVKFGPHCTGLGLRLPVGRECAIKLKTRKSETIPKHENGPRD
jgi:hypothetical protein